MIRCNIHLKLDVYSDYIISVDLDILSMRVCVCCTYVCHLSVQASDKHTNTHNQTADIYLYENTSRWEILL